MTSHVRMIRLQRKTLIRNGQVLLPQGLKGADVELSEGVISEIGPKITDAGGSHVVDAKGKYVLPGFIDLHTNGIAGFDLTNGVYEPGNGGFDSENKIFLQGLDNALKEYARTGATRVLLASLAAPVEDLKHVFHLASDYSKSSEHFPQREVFGGLYIEGTFMKMAEYRGAHNQEYFNEPSIKLFHDLQEAAGGLIKVVNIVPEWGNAALHLIKHLTSEGVVCAAGHTGATGNQYILAIESGTKLAVHFLNGPSSSSSKPFCDGGAVESVLRAEEVFVEIIADGYHVDKSYVLDIIKRKGFDRIIIITDSMFAALLRGLRRFRVLGVEGKVSANGEYLQIVDRGNALFGSSLTMDRAFSNVLNWLTTRTEGIWYKEHEALAFEEALVKASTMCSRNPARLLGIYDPGVGEYATDLKDCTGSIGVGKRADLLIADIERGQDRYKLKIDRVFVKGESI